MRRNKIERVDRIELARFWKVPFEMGGVNLDVGQIPAVPATVLSMIFVRLNCAKGEKYERVKTDHREAI